MVMIFDSTVLIIITFYLVIIYFQFKIDSLCYNFYIFFP